MLDLAAARKLNRTDDRALWSRSRALEEARHRTRAKDASGEVDISRHSAQVSLSIIVQAQQGEAGPRIALDAGLPSPVHCAKYDAQTDRASVQDARLWLVRIVRVRMLWYLGHA